MSNSNQKFIGPISARAPYDARQVANFLLDTAESAEVEMTNLKLLKLLFFCYGWYYAAFDRSLFHNPIEAWEFGPVVRAVWSSFSVAKAEPIRQRAAYLDLQSGAKEVVPSTLETEDEDFVRQTAREYLHHSAWRLSEITHEEGSPWHATWHAGTAAANLGMRISDDSIREYFLRLRSPRF